MSHSVVRDFPTEKDDTLILVVNKNGELSVDRETLDSYAKLNTQVSIIRVDGEDGDAVEMTVDAFRETEILGEIAQVNNQSRLKELTVFDHEDEITRNFNSFLNDHCYTLLTSPVQQQTPSTLPDDNELDDLAHALSILEGAEPVKTIKEVARAPQIIKTAGLKVENNKERVEPSDKVTLLNKVNSKLISTSGHKVYKGVKTVVKSAKVVKKIEQAASVETDSEDDDLNDSDYELESPNPRSRGTQLHHQQKKVYGRRKTKPVDHHEVGSTEVRNKIVKVRKGVKHIVYKAATPQKPALASTEPSKHPDPPVAQTVLQTPEPVKSPETKKPLPIKKDKKIPKPPIDDGIALFSTPDIIRRVGGDKPGVGNPKLESPESPTKIKPAKIEDRSKSESGRSSVDSKPKLPHRHSLDSIKTPDKLATERRSSVSDKPEPPVDAPSVATPSVVPPVAAPPILSNHLDATFDKISEAVGNLENANPTLMNPPPLVPTLNAVLPTLPNVEPSQMNLDEAAAAIGMDQNILDNISPDELIPEDILYQVAKLVENPDVQNVIDRTLVDGSLSLPPMQTPLTPQPMPVTQTSQVTPNQHILPPTNTTPTPQIASKTTPKPIQIIRSDGRVVTLPPIEKPATRSSKKKQEPSLQPQPVVAQIVPQQQQQQPQVILQHVVQQQIVSPKIQPIPQQNRPQPHPKVPSTLPITPSTPMRDPMQEHDDLLSDSDESWNSEDDPDRLWCICKQPHNNRFMICCDTCEDWFHGKCVNVTKAMGQLMEQQGKEWMCPNCIKKTQLPMVTASPHPSTPTRPAKLPIESAKRKSTESGPSCIVCGNSSRANSVYCSDTCILKHAQGVEKQNLVQSKLQLVKNPQGKEGVGLAVSRKGIQVGVLPHSAKPGTIKLIPAAKMAVPGTKPPQPKKLPETPIPKLRVQTTLKSPPVKQEQQKIATSTPKLKTPRERKQKLVQTPENPKPHAQENIRETVKKTLNEQLLTRLKDVEDIKLTEDEVDKMANDIETQLYKLFGDSGPKYRAKYRSLIFNIKDTKNQTLWRRICEKSIAPYQLVRLSPEEMASQELAMWRERENKHQLDMIKKSELEMLTINRTYVLKTHKGEQVMEDRPSVKVDSTEIMSGLGADSTSEPDASEKLDKTDASDRSSEKKSSSKHSRRDRDRKSSKDRTRDRSNSKDRKNSSSGSKDHSSTSKSKSSKRSRSRDRSSHRSDRKRSRSRDRHHRSSHKSSRHKREKHSNEHLDKKSREILSNLENNKIIAPPEDRLWKHVPQQDIQVTPDSDSDHEPTSTVTIPTPPRSTEQEDSLNPIVKKEDIVEPPPTPSKIEEKDEIAEKIVKEPRIRETSKEIVKLDSPEPPTTPPSSSPVPVSPSNSKYTSESKESMVWEGNITMVDVAKFSITLHAVSGDCSGLGTELPSTLEIVGRIPPDTVWDYVGKMRRSNSKLISILRLTACNVEEQMPYIALYMYLNSRTRFGVIKSTNSAVKDFYIMPLASHAPVPQALLPLSGPGFEESRPHLLLGIIVRAKRKRPSPMDIISNTSIKRSRVENSPTISTPSVSSTPTQPARSYTPPPTRDPRIKLPAVPTTPNDDDEPYSPEDSDPESTTTPVVKKPPAKAVASAPQPPAAPSAIKPDLAAVLSTLKNASFLDPPAATSFEPFKNKFDAIPGLDVSETPDSLAIARKIEELNKCIEQEKEQIDTMSQNLVSSGAAASMATNLSNISLPSNLQQILDSIKKIPSTGGQESTTEEYCPSAPGYKTSTDELTIPLLLPKLNARSSQPSNSRAPLSIPPLDDGKPPSSSTIPLQLPVTNTRDSQVPTVLPTPEPPIELPNLTVPPPVVGVTLPNTSIPPPMVINTNLAPPIIPTIAFNLKPKVSPQPPAPPIITHSSQDKPISVLSSLSEEELIRKAAEMLGEAEAAPEEEQDEEEEDKIEEINQTKSTSFKSAPVLYTPTPVGPPPPKRAKIDDSQPPVPGLEDEFDS